MNRVFEFTGKEEIYKKCLYASIAHAVMVGKYDLLTDEIAWEGDKYLFQNMSGIRGVIAFKDDCVVCGIQNQSLKSMNLKSAIGEDLAVIKQLAEKEVYPYLLIEDDHGNHVPSVSALFWGEGSKLESCMSESDFMKYSENIFLPYLYEFDDLKRYWHDYYELEADQEELIYKIFMARCNESSFDLDSEAKEKLARWFGDKVENCKKSFMDIGIAM